MDKLIDTLIKYKTEREVDEHNESHEFRYGYVKAINDSINLFKKINGDIDKRTELINKLWTLWQNLAEAGELTIDENFNKLYNVLKEQVDVLNGDSTALPLHGVMHCPDWLHDNHKAEAIRLYRIRKVDGVKYLCDIARKHLVNPLKWSYDFLKGCA
jgi:hypothetical protein